MLNFIVNIKSGKGRGAKILKKITNHLDKEKVEYMVHKTDKKGHASELSNMLSRGEENTIVAVGGDGTFHEVLNGIYDLEKTVVGFIPAGRGNDYARAANLNSHPLKALNAILSGEVVRTDFFTVDKVRCLNVAGCGLDTEVLKRVAGKTDKISYLTSLVHCLRHFDPYQMTVKMPEMDCRFEKIIMVGVCNGQCIGGGMKLSPHSKVDDGILNTVAIEMPKNGKIMKAMTSFLKGKHIDKEYTKHFESDEVLVIDDNPGTIQIDGELYDDIKFECKIVKGGLRTFKVTDI